MTTRRRPSRSEASPPAGPGAAEGPVGTPSAGASAGGGAALRPPPPEVVAGLVAARDGAGLFFDIDGVLAPIVARPDDARVPEPVRRALAGLVGGYRLVALVSGRTLDDAVKLVGLEGVVVVGDHGRELRDADGVVLRVAAKERRVLERVAAELAADEVLTRLGVRVEVKRASLALHVRGARDERAALEAAAAAAAAAGPGLVCHRGRAVVDLKLPGVDKGTAVGRLADRHGLGAALYVGDDRTDVDAMRALRALGAEEEPETASASGPPVAPGPPVASGPPAAAERPAGVDPAAASGRRRLSPLVLVGVYSDEMPDELGDVSDYLVRGESILALLRALRPPGAGWPDTPGAR